MPALRLVPIDVGLRETLDASPQAFEARYGAALGDNGELVREVVAQTLALYERSPRAAEWGGCLAADDARGLLIGTCGYTHGPEHDGTVEIAYFTFPQFEGQGYATAMGRELLRRGTVSPDVRAVVAHTLPEPNASTRILEKIGLRHAGAVEDPEDGTIWRWLHP